MELDSIILSEVSQTEKEKYHMWNLKRNDTNELTYKIERDSQKMNFGNHLLMYPSLNFHSIHTSIFFLIVQQAQKQEVPV